MPMRMGVRLGRRHRHDRVGSGLYLLPMTQVVVCGAGIAGVSTAFHLTRAGVTDVLVVDPRPPLTLTSDKSTECYRNWWPNKPMVQLMSRSIELLDQYAIESGNVFNLNRRGYLYLTAEPAGLDALARQAVIASAAGAGPLRTHTTDASSYHPAAIDGFEDAPLGSDLFMDGDTLRSHFPSIADSVVGGLHARTAGWLSAQQLGMWLLEQAEAAGATFHRAAVTSVQVSNEKVSAIGLDDGTSVRTKAFVNAAGPHLATVGELVGLDLPVVAEVHAKTAFRDHLGLFPRDFPMVIWNDPQRVSWTSEEARYLEAWICSANYRPDATGGRKVARIPHGRWDCGSTTPQLSSPAGRCPPIPSTPKSYCGASRRSSPS